MTEELKQKLNDLLGLKKQLEEIKEEKIKNATSSVLELYKKQRKWNFIRLCIALAIGWGAVIFGTIIYIYNTDIVSIDCPTIIITGLLVMLISKVCWLIRNNKLTLLQEMKESELRILEAIKK